MIDLRMMAEQLSQRSQHPPEEWHSILNAAIHDPALTQMTDGELDLLVESMQSPHHLEWTLELFRDSFMKMTNEMPFDYLVRHVNQSADTLSEWMQALPLAFDHCKKSQASTDLQHLIDMVQEARQKAGKDCACLLDAVKSQLT